MDSDTNLAATAVYGIVLDTKHVFGIEYYIEIQRGQGSSIAIDTQTGQYTGRHEPSSAAAGSMVQ
jgi:hypothetical protein